MELGVLGKQDIHVLLLLSCTEKVLAGWLRYLYSVSFLVDTMLLLLPDWALPSFVWMGLS